MRVVTKYGFLCCTALAVGITSSAYAQFDEITDIPFYRGAHQLYDPLTGGMNAPQFSEIDLNLDGKKDLFIYERSAYKILTFINEGSPGITKYRYAPEYESIFPHLEDWALIRDFNCDGVPDIFAYSLGSTEVFKGKIVDGTLSFDLFKSKLTYPDIIVTPVYTARTDIPAFDDIDGDGDMDILSFVSTGALIRYYRNMSEEMGYGCDSLIYELTDLCWGQIFETSSCGGADLHVSCKGGTGTESDTDALLQHVGSTFLTFDKDGDGDKDLLLGDVSCTNLIFYRNGGDNTFANISSKDSSFPSNTVPFSMIDFNAAYFVDADNDGIEDIVATTNNDLTGENTQNVWLYKNLNTNDTMDFQFVTDTLLIGEMVDVGTYSKPVFFDYNGDGLQDIVIGIGNYFGRYGSYRYGLWLYKNTGTATAPAYALVDTDFAGLAQYHLNYLDPDFADLDHDGDLDLLCGTYDGSLIYAENTAGPGADAAFGPAQFNYQGIDVGAFSAPFVIDADGDSIPDLVVGEQNGNLNYYHNDGTATAPSFTLVSDLWGGVDVRATGYFTGFSTPYLYRNANDSLVLLCGSESGRVFRYDEIDGALMGEFYRTDTDYLHFYPGNYVSVSGADIDGDGNLDFLLGNVRGGISILEHSAPNGISQHTDLQQLELFPNPSGNYLEIRFGRMPAGNVRIRIYDLSGRSCLQSSLLPDNKALHIDVQKLPPGCYVLQAEDRAGNTWTGRFIRE